MSEFRIPVEPLCAAFLSSRKAPTAVARELGWMKRRSQHYARQDGGTSTYDYEQGDAQRLKRALGLVPDRPRHGYALHRTTISESLAKRIGDELGLDPWEYGL